jgi:diguanylate cyclase (GGDEF)-like protein
MLGFSVVYFSHRLWRLEYLYQHFNSLQDSRNETAKADVKPAIQAPANLLEIASFEQFKRFSNQEIERSSRYQNAYSIVLIKVTHFSAYRDKLGAEEADKLLVKFAIFIQTQLRKIDLLARYENEQLLIGLPEAGLYQALDTAERIQQALEQEFWKAFPNSFHLGSRLTVASVESPLCSLDMLLKKATKAMNKQANTKTLSYGS